MKRVELSSAGQSLASYAASLDGEMLVVTRHQRPVAVVVPLSDPKWEWLALGRHPDFAELLAALPDTSRRSRSRQAGLRKGGGEA